MTEINIDQADKLAREVLNLSRNTLLVNMRFLDTALSRLTFIADGTETIMTDGEMLYYNPLFVLKRFAEEQTASTRDYLHIVFHCIFRHMFVAPNVNIPLWDLACDIVVEAAITGMGLPSVTVQRESEQAVYLYEITKGTSMLTAEKIYRYYLDTGLSEDEITDIREYFLADDHSVWYMQKENSYGLGKSTQSNDENGSDGISSNEGIRGDSDEGSDENKSESESGKEESENNTLFSREALEQMWKDISEHIQQDLETFSRERGDQAGGLIQNLASVNREKYDYSYFLKKFAVRGEAMKLDPDEFDYIYYTYGLQLYEKMPLIEPLEYREAKRIREFVIAVDTSGSTTGELVQKFVQKTYNILKSTESFFSRINLHIIQCDTTIQEDVKITNQLEFDEYLKNMKLHGFGGTDFRPVFKYVDEMIANHEFFNLKGLIYFTDGFGVFPKNKPQYDTAFVFIDDDYGNPEVPPWAIKLILQSNEI